MISQWLYRIDDEAGRAIETSHGFPTRMAAAIVILAAAAFADTTPLMPMDAGFVQRARGEQQAPSACGAEAVARAREIDQSRQRQRGATDFS